MKKMTIELTSQQQKQIKDATGKSITALNIDLEGTGHLSEEELKQVTGGKGADKTTPILSFKSG